MSKRKAQVEQNEFVNSMLGGTQNDTNYANASETQITQTPMAFAEKRKKISSNFPDLSQLIDTATDREIKVDKSQLHKIPGTIERIHLKNFKCHSLLEFDLHQYINFILGRNGSGKSAVMDGIILCLGGRATCTGRQASVKTFIKTNCDKAELSLTLRNEGSEAYKPDVYGSRIIIERRLGRDGSSQYKIMDENRKVLSNKKTEIDNIVEQFNIQVENPVCFLNQETSKHFLNTSNKADKYKLFMKASQIESMRQLQERINQEKNISESLINEKASYLPRLEEELFTWEDKYKKCQSVDKLRKKLSILMTEYSWSVVSSMEKQIEGLEKDRRTTLKQKEKIDTKLKESEEMLQKSNAQFDEIKAQINQTAQQAKDIQVARENANSEYKKSSSSYKSVQIDLRKLQNIVEKKKKDKKELSDKLEEDKRNTAVDYEEEKRQKEEKIEAIQAKMKENNDIEKFKINENRMYQSGINQIEKQIDEKKFDVQNYEKSIRNLNSDIENLRNASQNRIYRYGDYMDKLVADVKRHYDMKKFKQMPIGPIGMYIDLKDNKWGLAIEHCIGKLCTTFICGNHADESLMHKLIAQHVQIEHQRPRVTVTDFSTPLYDVSRYRPENTKYSTVYEMLNIKNHVVANVLIDSRKIESILLLPDRNVGREVIEYNSTNNCSEAFLMNGDQLLGRPTYRMYGCHFKQVKYFVENTDSAIELKRKEIAKLNENLIAVKREIVNLKEEVNKNISLKQTNDKQIDQIKKMQLALHHNLKDAENISIPEPIDLAVFEEEINKIDKEVEEFLAQIQTIQENNSELKSAFEKAASELGQIEKEVKTISERGDELRIKKEEVQGQISEHTAAVQHYKKLMVEVERKEKDQDDKIVSEKSELDKVIKSAEELSPRIETKKSSTAIDTEIKGVEKQIQATEKLHGNEEEITKKYLEMRTRYKKIQDDIKKQRRFLDKLEIVLKKREQATVSFTQSKALRCAMCFNNYLHSRNFTGQLKFNHEQQILDINVQPNKIGKDSKDSRDLKSLSGGERSYSTVAFLLSLWSIVESPLLFLDEFDVFMDQINRSFAMELILSAAKENLNGQYVFLTPQEMGNIRPDEYVKMFKMPDPKRSIDMCYNTENQENE